MKIFFAFLLSLCPVLAFAQEPTAEQALNTVVESEGKFAQMAQEQNTRAAFLEFLAPDAIVFHPGPVNGQELWKKRPENYISLSWKPLFAAIARSADLAYTTGPAEWREKKEDEKPYGYAQFVSIWKKQKDGSWKVALDVGNEVPGPIKGDEAPQLELSLPNETSNAAADLAAAKSKLQQAETQFATAA